MYWNFSKNETSSYLLKLQAIESDPDTEDLWSDSIESTPVHSMIKVTYPRWSQERKI